MTRINDEKCGRKLRHLDQATETGEQFLDLAIDHEAFALGVFLKLARLALGHEFVETLDALVDVFEIGERTADPATCDIRRTDAFCRSFDEGDRLVLAGCKKDLLAALCEDFDEHFCTLQALRSLLKVEDVGAFLGTKEEGGGSRVAASTRQRKMRARVVQCLHI